jgi:hypothetical protein
MVAPMVAKEWALQNRAQKPVDEIFFQNEAVSLCLLVNRRARVMRVIDFRAGPSSAKRLFVLSLAQREGVEKVCTLVERDEVQTWLKLGFVKEGNIPGFYKRSDAFMLGCTLRDAVAAPAGRPRDRDEVPLQSEMRLVAAQPGAVSPPLSEAHQLALQAMERTIVLAKRAAKDLPSRALGPAKVTSIAEADARKAVAVAARSGQAMTGFEPFGRDVQRRYFVATARGSFALHASIESQACFGNAYLELLRGPRTDAELLGTAASLKALCDKLVAEEIVSCFALAPTDDIALATAFVHNGFRRTGMLAEHLVVGSERKDAILWSRKMSNLVADE